jgi:hypothetical protein
VPATSFVNAKMASDRDIAELLTSLGFVTPELKKTARDALEAASLTRAGKQRLSTEKVPVAEALLRERFFLACSSSICQGALRKARPKAAGLTVPSTAVCEYCQGSDNHRALLRLAEACARARVRRILVVGGSPALHTELIHMKPAEWELRLVIGTERRTLDRAKADLDWAQLVLIWGGSELDHKVSTLYTTRADAKGKMVSIAKRGIAALFTAAAEHLGG